MSLQYIKPAEAFLERNGFRVENAKSLNPGNIVADLYGFREGYSLWKFFPFEEHFFFHDLNGPGRNSAETLMNLHDGARAWVNYQFTKPKWMCCKAPSIVTVGFSESGYSSQMKAMASKPASYGVGGEKHSIFLIDTGSNTIYSSGIQRASSTAVDGKAEGSVTVAPKNVDPINRAYHMIIELMKEVLN